MHYGVWLDVPHGECAQVDIVNYAMYAHIIYADQNGDNSRMSMAYLRIIDHCRVTVWVMVADCCIQLLEKVTKCGSITWLKLTNGELCRTSYQHCVVSWDRERRVSWTEIALCCAAVVPASAPQCQGRTTLWRIGFIEESIILRCAAIKSTTRPL